MLLNLAQWLQSLSPEWGFLRVFQYITFRAVMAALTALLMGLLVYATLPLVTAQDEHVRAGILQMWRTAPAGLGRALFQLRRLLSCIALAYLAWALFNYMLRVAKAGDRAPYIEVPLSWVAAFGALCMALSACLVVWSQRRVGATS